jgi:SPP1 family predicted phage head-tail adaptor
VSVGQYRKLFTVQAPVTTDDGSGGQSVTWSAVRTVWANVEALSMREQAQAGALQVLASRRVITHYSGAIQTTHRLVPKGWTGTTLEVLGVSDPDGQSRELWLDCAEVI